MSSDQGHADAEGISFYCKSMRTQESLHQDHRHALTAAMILLELQQTRADLSKQPGFEVTRQPKTLAWSQAEDNSLSAAATLAQGNKPPEQLCAVEHAAV